MKQAIFGIAFIIFGFKFINFSYFETCYNRLLIKIKIYSIIEGEEIISDDAWEVIQRNIILRQLFYFSIAISGISFIKFDVSCFSILSQNINHKGKC